jgi:hypothetical protein
VSRRRPEPTFQLGDRVQLLTMHWRDRSQRGTVRRPQWMVGTWRYLVKLDGRKSEYYNRTSLRHLSAIELLGELA